ncbi:hypothetical protein BC835DRAFT_1303730 [Cytidiella melzeri]|nr:hypothetical protein BC835DRAFT_1303730 [Cytidiella melzeri]
MTDSQVLTRHPLLGSVTLKVGTMRLLGNRDFAVTLLHAGAALFWLCTWPPPLLTSGYSSKIFRWYFEHNTPSGIYLSRIQTTSQPTLSRQKFSKLPATSGRTRCQRRSLAAYSLYALPVFKRVQTSGGNNQATFYPPTGPHVIMWHHTSGISSIESRDWPIAELASTSEFLPGCTEYHRNDYGAENIYAPHPHCQSRHSCFKHPPSPYSNLKYSLESLHPGTCTAGSSTQFFANWFTEKLSIRRPPLRPHHRIFLLVAPRNGAGLGVGPLALLRLRLRWLVSWP